MPVSNSLPLDSSQRERELERLPVPKNDSIQGEEVEPVSRNEFLFSIFLEVFPLISGALIAGWGYHVLMKQKGKVGGTILLIIGLLLIVRHLIIQVIKIWFDLTSEKDAINLPFFCVKLEKSKFYRNPIFKTHHSILQMSFFE